MRAARPGRWLSPALLVCPLPSTVTPPCCGWWGPAPFLGLHSNAQCCFLSLLQGLCTSCSLCLQPLTSPHWLSPVHLLGLDSNPPTPPTSATISLVTVDLFVCLFVKYPFSYQRALRAGPTLFDLPLSPWHAVSSLLIVAAVGPGAISLFSCSSTVMSLNMGI